MSVKSVLSGRTDSGAVQFFRYIFVGGGATVVQYAVLFLLTELFDIDANISAFFGFLGGLTVNYLVSTVWVFDRKNSAIKSKAAEFGAFALIGVIGLLMTEGIIWLFDKPLAANAVLPKFIPTDKYYAIGQITATGTVFFWNFFARKYLLFNKKGDR